MVLVQILVLVPIVIPSLKKNEHLCAGCEDLVRVLVRVRSQIHVLVLVRVRDQIRVEILDWVRSQILD